jgi:beta-lactamase regulating signal transducer with metallopeptidase domain
MNTGWLLETAVRTLIMGSITLLALQTLRIEQIQARRTAWLLALAGALVMPLLVAAHLGPRILPEITHARTAQFSAETGLAASPAEFHALPMPDAATLKAIPAAAAAARPPLTERAARLVFNLYVAVALVLALRLGVGLAMALRLKRRARPIAALVDADVRVSAELASPVTVTSSILLPQSYLRWDAATLRVVLSHEFAHVQQKDFYVQLLAGLHCALFWFNPFSWWLQRQLSDLGEALSDHAAAQQAESPASYAELLLRFAAGEHPPFAAIAMARSSNLAPRIERLLNERGFERCFCGQRRLGVVAAGVVMLALLASTCMTRVVAAEPSVMVPTAPELPQVPAAPAVPGVAPPPEAPMPPEAPPAPARPAPVKPVRPIPPFIASVSAPAPLDGHARDAGTWTEITDTGVSYAKVDQDEIFVIKTGDSRLMFDGDFKARFGREIPAPEGDFIFYQHHGKPYLIQDPAIVAKARELLAPLKDSNSRQAALGSASGELARRRRVLQDRPFASTLSTPEFEAAMDELAKLLLQMKNDRLPAQADHETLLALQNKLSSIQGRLGKLQGEIALQTSGAQLQAELGAQQAQLAADQARMAAEREKVAADNQHIIREARRALAPLIEQAIKDGRAKPAN